MDNYDKRIAYIKSIKDGQELTFTRFWGGKKETVKAKCKVTGSISAMLPNTPKQDWHGNEKRPSHIDCFFNYQGYASSDLHNWFIEV